MKIKSQINKMIPDSMIPDRLYSEFLYERIMGKPLNLNSPKTYTEKLQWLKLYDHDPRYTDLVDKYEVKRIIEQKIGKECTIPTIGVWDKFDEINFEALPSQFVLKCTHDSGSAMICEDKDQFDISAARSKMNKNMETNYYWKFREWPYKNVKPRIIAEPLMKEEKSDRITDYKFFCFDGIPKILKISKEKSDDCAQDFFDENFYLIKMSMGHPNSKIPPSKPECFEEMKSIAAVLSRGIPHIRVDFYYVSGKVYVGELTFYHDAGLSVISPEEWNMKMGEWINLDLAYAHKKI